MHLNDSFGKIFKDRVHSLHHEQSCAIAAESYSRHSAVPAVVNVTAGGGGINAINGVFGAYVDSLPLIVISGQAKRETLVTRHENQNLRQLGDQEVDIVSMVAKVCKYSALIVDPRSIQAELDYAFHIATSGRPGPVWLDIPIDVQSTPFLETDSVTSTAQGLRALEVTCRPAQQVSEEDLFRLASKLLESSRPTLYVGAGIRIGQAYEEFLAFLDKWPIATVTSWNSNDLLWDDHSNYSGRPGTVGNRAGNFAVQYSNAVLIVGTRLNIRAVSFNWKSFAKNAWKCHVVFDEAELTKPTLDTDLRIHATSRGFFPKLSEALEKCLLEKSLSKNDIFAKWSSWISFNKRLLSKYHATKDALPQKSTSVNPYRFIDKLSNFLPSGSITVCADGTACVVGFQAFTIKKDQRLYHNSGCASMGYELPAAIGAYHATNKEIICLAGDGSIMMNIQDLATIGGLKLPIKVILLNNQGYHSIRQTQNNYFPSNPVGCGVESGLPFPDFQALSVAFGLRYHRLERENDMELRLTEFLALPGPSFLEVHLDLEQQFAPKLASKKLGDGSMVTAELEDMTPLLQQDEMKAIRQEANLIV